MTQKTEVKMQGPEMKFSSTTPTANGTETLENPAHAAMPSGAGTSARLIRAEQLRNVVRLAAHFKSDAKTPGDMHARWRIAASVPSAFAFRLSYRSISGASRLLAFKTTF
jgi:hypothetical protein